VGGALGGGSFISLVSLVFVVSIGFEGGNNDLALKIPDLDALISGGTEPVPVGAEDKRVDDFTSIQTVKLLAFVQVPKVGGSVLSSGSTERPVRGDTDGVQVSGVSYKVVAELAVGKSPYLNKAVPSTRNNEWNRLRRAETDARDPLGVSLSFSTSDGVLALSKGVPEFDSLITRSRNNLTVVNRESNR